MAFKLKEPAVPVSKVVLGTLVMDGAWFTVSVKAWLVLPELLVAVMVRLYTPPVAAAGVPLNTPVFAFSVKPSGRDVLPVIV